MRRRQPPASATVSSADRRGTHRIAKMPRMRVISLEEHFWTPAIAEAIGALRNPDTRRSRHAAGGQPGRPGRAAAGRHGRGRHRPAGHQPHDAGRAAPRHPRPPIPLAREANDELARAVAEHPDRFAGFATLPTLGARRRRGRARARGHRAGHARARWSTATPSGRFLDDPAFDVLLARFERLGVPLYLHPAEPVPAVRDAYYAGFNPAVSLVPQRGRLRLARRDRPARPAHGPRAASSIAIPGCSSWSATWARCSRSCSRASTTTCRPR